MLTHVSSIADAVRLARKAVIGCPPDANGRVEITPAFLKYVEQQSGLEISVDKDRQVASHTCGIIRRYQKLAAISVCTELNQCWTRFVVCKELMHLLGDVDPVCFNSDAADQLTRMMSVGQFSASANVTSESFAFIAAVEYMLPRDRRPKDCNGDTSFMKVAEQFKVPRVYVELAYTPLYKQMSEQTD
jgi:hypothetical protein